VPSDADVLKALSCALHDSLMVLAPPGWTRIELELVSSSGGLRVKELSAKGAGATQPAPRPPLNIDAREEASRLGEGLTELARILATHGKPWDGGRVEVVRGKDFSEWKLLLPDGATRWSTRLLSAELEALVFTDELFDLLRGTHPAFQSLQAAFEARLGQLAGHEFSEGDQLLSLKRADGVVRARAQLVGSYTRENFLWVWGWAVEELAAGCCDRVRRVCAPEAAQPGLSALWREHFHCDEGFAWALAGHVMVAIGARGLVRVEAPGLPAIVLYAVLEDPG